jgi:O-succinylbenzoate synthase
MTITIERIELFLVNMQLKDPFETSFGVEFSRECIIVNVAGEGELGWGECVAGNYPGYNAETTGTAWHVLEQFFIPAVLGQKIDDIEHYRKLIGQYKGHQLARAGLEMALWDLFGRAQGRSLREMLGGERSSVPVGVSIGLQADEHSLGAVVDDFLEEGYQRVKLKIKPGVDLSMVKYVREAHPDLALQVDANSAYTLEDASVFQEMDEYELILIEQPLAEDDIIDHSRLQELIRTPICLDESILHLRHARQAVETDACKIINIKPGRVGGLSEAKAIHDYCKGVGVPVWCGGMLETNIGRASNLAIASLPGFLLPGDISASERYYEEDIADPDFVLNVDSTIAVPQGSGLGISVREESLKKFTMKRKAFHA